MDLTDLSTVISRTFGMLVKTSAGMEVIPFFTTIFLTFFLFGIFKEGGILPFPLTVSVPFFNEQVTLAPALELDKNKAVPVRQKLNRNNKSTFLFCVIIDESSRDIF